MLGLIIIWVVLLDAFETVVLPRRVLRHFKLTAWFYRQHVDSVEEDREPHQDDFAAAEFSGIFWAAVADPAAGVLGGGADSWIRPDSIRHWRARAAK